ncbi:FAD-binding oxidoreductase [Leuconostoc suionicum]|nr:FAD-binding oxidoreductase [Leuconostoc suionicum]
MLKSHKYWLGLFWMAAIFVLPLPLIQTLSQGMQNTINMSKLFASQIGIIAYVWMLFAIAISIKPKWIDKLIGLPEMYFVHGILGVSAIVLAFTHKMMLQSSGLIKQTGDIALIIFIGIAAYSIFFMSGWLTSRSKVLRKIKTTIEKILSYEVSVWLHRLNIVATLLVFAHVILIPYIVTITPFMTLFFVYSGVTAVMYLYYHFGKPLLARHGQLIANKKLAHSVTELVIRLNKNAQIHPGDFVYISFPEVDGFKEMHPFSILRYDQAQRELVFAIRNWGDFTAKLDKIPVGAKVKIDGSYGRLSESIKENEGKHLVFIGSGVGSVPLISLTRSLIDKHKVSFIRVASKQEDLIYESDLQDLAVKNPNLDYASQVGRLKENQVKTIVAKNRNSFYIVGGSTPMMVGTMKLLQDAGVRKADIYGEKFNF